MNSFDHLEIRCPRLGHEVPFSYCRRESGRLPCARILTCWQPFFHVESYLKKSMPAEQWTLFINQAPKEKIITLIDMIEAAKKRQVEKK
jgi:hypothetical protein